MTDLLTYDDQTTENIHCPPLEPYTTKGPALRVLVLEDDACLIPYLERVITEVAPGSGISWAFSEEKAEHMIEDQEEIGLDFDLIVCDILLLGTRSGLDLWKKYSHLRKKFIFMSGINVQSYYDLISKESDYVPPFLQKPLNYDYCRTVLERFVHTR